MSEEEKKELNERLQNPEISYQKLRALLATKQWRKADEETYRLMRDLINLPYSKLDAVQTRCFPKSDIHRIDQLWVEYSKGQFGFSVQNKVWQRSRFRAEFLDRIAFSEPPAYYHREFDLGSPKGSLPCKILWEVEYGTLYDEFFTD